MNTEYTKQPDAMDLASALDWALRRISTSLGEGEYFARAQAALDSVKGAGAGWTLRLIPNEPTQEMVDAWQTAFPKDDIRGLADDEANRRCASANWRAMIEGIPVQHPALTPTAASVASPLMQDYDRAEVPRFNQWLASLDKHHSPTESGRMWAAWRACAAGYLPLQAPVTNEELDNSLMFADWHKTDAGEYICDRVGLKYAIDWVLRGRYTPQPAASVTSGGEADIEKLPDRTRAAYLQCKVVVHLARSLAEVHEASMSILAKTNSPPTEIIGERSASIMETLGDWLSDMDAVTDDEEWTDLIFEEAQLLWPVDVATTAQLQPRTDAGQADGLQGLHDALYLAQRSTGAAQEKAISEARAILHRHREGQPRTPAEPVTVPRTEAPDTPEMKAVGAFLAGMYDSKLNGAAMREAMLWSLDLAAGRAAPPACLSDSTKSEPQAGLILTGEPQAAPVPHSGFDPVVWTPADEARLDTAIKDHYGAPAPSQQAAPTPATQAAPHSNLAARCSEIIGWQNTGILKGEALRELAAALPGEHDDHDGLQRAESKTTREAMEFVVARAANQPKGESS